MKQRFQICKMKLYFSPNILVNDTFFPSTNKIIKLQIVKGNVFLFSFRSSCWQQNRFSLLSLIKTNSLLKNCITIFVNFANILDLTLWKYIQGWRKIKKTFHSRTYIKEIWDISVSETLWGPLQSLGFTFFNLTKKHGKEHYISVLYRDPSNKSRVLISVY